MTASRCGMRLCLAGFTVVTLLATCTKPPPAGSLKQAPHYVLGPSYRAGKIWYYPTDSFDLDETGIATVIDADTPRLTTDGELFDQTALTGAHPTLQLPAIARVTNLDNGREVVVRLNDRGSGNPGRLVEVTRRTAALLEFPPSGLARVRLQVLPNESHAAIQAVPGAPSLAMTPAPRGVVEIAVLLPPPGVQQGNGRALHQTAAAGPEQTAPVAPLMRMPEAVSQTVPKPGNLIVRLDAFSEYHYAALQCSKMGWSTAHIASVYEGRAHYFRAESDPLLDVAHADAVLKQAMAAGIPDARIVVE